MSARDNLRGWHVTIELLDTPLGTYIRVYDADEHFVKDATVSGDDEVPLHMAIAHAIANADK